MFKLFLGETCFHYSPSYFHVYQFDWTLILLNCFVFTHQNFCGEDERQINLHDSLSFRLFQWITFLIATIWIQIEGRLIFKLKMAKNLRLLNGWYACWKVMLIIFKKQVLSLGFLIRIGKKRFRSHVQAHSYNSRIWFVIFRQVVIIFHSQISEAFLRMELNTPQAKDRY